MPVLVVFVLSQVLPQSIWGTRQLTFVAAPYLLLAGMSLDALRPAWLRRGIVAIVAAYVLVAGAQGLNETGRNDWRPLVQRMIEAEESRGAPVLVYAFGSMDEVIAFYASEAPVRHPADSRRERDAGRAFLGGLLAVRSAAHALRCPRSPRVPRRRAPA